jgi:hypothetical protein
MELSHSVQLITGEQVSLSLVTSIQMALEALIADGHTMALYELVSFCNNPSHKFFGGTAEILVGEGLIKAEAMPGTYSIHADTRAIVLAALTQTRLGVEYNIDIIAK